MPNPNPTQKQLAILERAIERRHKAWTKLLESQQNCYATLAQELEATRAAMGLPAGAAREPSRLPGRETVPAASTGARARNGAEDAEDE